MRRLRRYRVWVMLVCMLVVTGAVGRVVHSLDPRSRNAPLARAVIGGLAVSTVLTLILIPTLYVILEERFPRRVEGPDSELALQGDRA